MIFVWASAIVYLFEWIAPVNEWTGALGGSYLITALLFSALLSQAKGWSLIAQSALAVLTLSAWADVTSFIVWHGFDCKVNLSPWFAMLFLIWFSFAIIRQYPKFGGKVDENICILVMHPKTPLQVIKGLFGYSASSICIVADHHVWAFRRKSGVFEKVKFNFMWYDDHYVINTGVPCSKAIVEELEKLVSTSSFPYCKCVWSIRDVLKLVGGKYAIKSWLDYVPGFYVWRILKK